MYYVKRAIYGPDPQEQKRKCGQLIRKNQRELERQLLDLGSAENRAKTEIKRCAKRNDLKSARLLAKEVYNIKKQRSRLYKSKAQLNSVSLQVNEAFAMRKLEGSMKSSTGLMKEVNQLVHMPELMGTMTELSKELMKSGIIDEMVADTLDGLEEDQFLEDSEAEEEVEAILGDIVGTKKEKAATAPITSEKPAQVHRPQPAAKVTQQQEAEESEDEIDEELMNDMRERLRALQG